MNRGADPGKNEKAGMEEEKTEEEEESLTVPKTPAKKNPVKHIPNIETPFNLKIKREIREKENKEEASEFMYSERFRELEEEGEWFRKKRLGRKMKPFKLVKTRAAPITKSVYPVCEVEKFFTTHYHIKQTLHTSNQSAVYLVESKKTATPLEEDRPFYCPVCSLIIEDPPETSVIKVSQMKWSSAQEKKERVREAKFLYRLRKHRNITHILRSWEERAVLYIEMSLCNQGTLKDYMRIGHSEDSTRNRMKLAVQMAKGLKDIHQAKIVHLDIKPDNIYLHKEAKGKVVVKIGDFGISRASEDASEIEFDGDRLYMAPELLQNTCSCASDVYSMGLVFTEFLFNIGAPLKTIPWGHISTKKKETIVESSGVSQPTYEIVKAMIDTDPQKRPTAAEVFQRLRKQSVHFQM